MIQYQFFPRSRGISDEMSRCFVSTDDEISSDNNDLTSNEVLAVLRPYFEAGQATENHRFLKDIFEACMMFDVEYLVLAVRNKYRSHYDFDRVYTFLETLYVSNRLHLPLTGILLIGY